MGREDELLYISTVDDKVSVFTCSAVPADMIAPKSVWLEVHFGSQLSSYPYDTRRREI